MSTSSPDMQPQRSRILVAALALAAIASTVAVAGHHFRAAAAQAGAAQPNVGWPVYAGNKEGQRFSPLTQITAANVKQLQVAWSFDTFEAGNQARGLQTQPLIVGRTMFVYTPSQKAIALDAATGKELWRFDAKIPSGQPDRGFTYWTDGKQKILFANIFYTVWALDPDTGKPITSFGKDGMLDMRKNFGPESPAGLIALTAPGVIYKDVIIYGFRAGEASPTPHGDIRAFDIHTGAMRWAFHTIPHPGEPGYETWPKEAWKWTGAANSWGGLALDEKRGIVYAPTGSAVTDMYGADRLGNNLYANCLLALDANTGKLVWYFQAVHHDMWDRDFPSQPTLVTVKHDGKMVDAVAQTSKHGFVFLFDRANGKPLFPIVEKPFPASNVPGEVASATQPIPSAPAPYARQLLTADMLTNRTPAAHAWAVDQFKDFISGGQFVPFSVDKQTVVFPGFDGGAEWGGSALDPKAGILYVNANDIAWTAGLGAVGKAGPGATTYGNQCLACHGPDRKGNPPAFPSLVDSSKTLNETQMTQVIHEGRGRMPGFPQITGTQLTELLTYVRTGQDPANPVARPGASPANNPFAMPTTPIVADRNDKEELPPGSGASSAPPAAYRFTGFHKFLDPDGYPAIVPPWGTLNAIDLNTGKYLWKIPLGEYPELVAQGMKDTGSENYGGPVVTAGGLLFIGATNFDKKMRAFDAKTGKLLWEYVMEGAGNATPSIYMVDGKQYIVIAISNARNPKAPQIAKYVAFALP